MSKLPTKLPLQTSDQFFKRRTCFPEKNPKPWGWTLSTLTTQALTKESTNKLVLNESHPRCEHIPGQGRQKQIDDPTKFTLCSELKAHAVPWQSRHVRPAITTCYLASVSIKPSTISTSWGKSSWKWLSGGEKGKGGDWIAHPVFVYLLISL